MANPPVRALVVDDEPLGRERIRTLLQDRDDVTVAGEAADGSEAITKLDAERFDLVFLDIQMPRKSGFDVVREIGISNMPPVLFVTAYDEHALEAFEVHAIDYLLKPFEPVRFHKAVDHVLDLMNRTAVGDLATRVQKLVDGLSPDQPTVSRLMVKSQDHIEFVDVRDIDWIEAAGNYANLHIGSKSLLIRQTMKSFEERLDSELFMRIHRSTIVNLERIKEVFVLFNGDYEVRLKDGTRLTLSRGYRHQLDRFS